MKVTELKEAFTKFFGDEADATFFSPGRINLI
ncbi:galactokinase family protein, partial [Streptococcus ferus]